MADDFSATVSAWVKETQARTEAVFKESAQEVLQLANDGVPVDTGFARASFTVALNSDPVTADRPNPGTGSFAYDPAVATLAIADAKLGDTITGSWGANYIRFLEYGTSKMAPRRFVALAVQQWQRIVQDVSARAQSRSK